MKRSKAEILIVGAGISGLAAAVEIARDKAVAVVERLPAAGGTWGFDNDVVRALHKECLARGVRFVLGATALKWRHNTLLCVGPGQTQLIEAQRLIFAGGLRPPTLTEAGILGSRLAGVFPATVALHLLEAKINIGHNVVIVGTTRWDSHLVKMMPQQMKVQWVDARHGENVALLDCSELEKDRPLKEKIWRGYHAQAVHGYSRVSSVEIRNSFATHFVSCDALIVNGGLRPLRNIEGAIAEDARFVSYLQNPQLDNDESIWKLWAQRWAFNFMRNRK